MNRILSTRIFIALMILLFHNNTVYQNYPDGTTTNHLLSSNIAPIFIGGLKSLVVAESNGDKTIVAGGAIGVEYQRGFWRPEAIMHHGALVTDYKLDSDGIGWYVTDSGYVSSYYNNESTVVYEDRSILFTGIDISNECWFATANSKTSKESFIIGFNGKSIIKSIFSNRLEAIAAHSCNDVIGVGEGGFVYAYDGISWNPVSVPKYDYVDISKGSNNEYWIIGNKINSHNRLDINSISIKLSIDKSVVEFINLRREMTAIDCKYMKCVLVGDRGLYIDIDTVGMKFSIATIGIMDRLADIAIINRDATEVICIGSIQNGIIRISNHNSQIELHNNSFVGLYSERNGDTIYVGRTEIIRNSDGILNRDDDIKICDSSYVVLVDSDYNRTIAACGDGTIRELDDGIWKLLSDRLLDQNIVCMLISQKDIIVGTTIISNARMNMQNNRIYKILDGDIDVLFDNVSEFGNNISRIIETKDKIYYAINDKTLYKIYNGSISKIDFDEEITYLYTIDMLSIGIFSDGFDYRIDGNMEIITKSAILPNGSLKIRDDMIVGETKVAVGDCDAVLIMLNNNWVMINGQTNKYNECITNINGIIRYTSSENSGAIAVGIWGTVIYLDIQDVVDRINNKYSSKTYFPVVGRSR